MSNDYRVEKTGAGFVKGEELVIEANGQLHIRVARGGDGSTRTKDKPEWALIRYANAPDDLSLIDNYGNRKQLGDLRKSARDYYSSIFTNSFAIALPGFWPGCEEGTAGLFHLGVEEAGRAWIQLCWDKLTNAASNATAVNITFTSMTPVSKDVRRLDYILAFQEHQWTTSIFLYQNEDNEWVPSPGREIAFNTEIKHGQFTFKWYGNHYFEMTTH